MSNLEFIVHPSPVLISDPHESSWEENELMRVKWKGLDFLQLVHAKYQGRDVADPADTVVYEDTEAGVEVPEDPKYYLRCLMPEFQVFHGDFNSIEEAKDGALRAEKLLTKFAGRIFRHQYKYPKARSLPCNSRLMT